MIIGVAHPFIQYRVERQHAAGLRRRSGWNEELDGTHWVWGVRTLAPDLDVDALSLESALRDLGLDPGPGP